MNINDYQTQASKTAKDSIKHSLPYAVLGLASEAGELAGKLKKILRDRGGKPNYEDVQSLRAEVGDCLWYVAQVCTAMGDSLETIAEDNLAKLADRQERGVIGGSGDNR